MGGARWLLVAAVTLVTLRAVISSPRIAHSQYVYRYKPEGKTCIYASFDMFFTLYYINDSSVNFVSFQLPNNTVVKVSGICDSEMTLSWNGNNSLTMKFGSGSGKWDLEQLSLTFNLSSLVPDLYENDVVLQTFYTNGSDLFKRTFKNDEYFYCKNCKMYKFGQYNETLCADECLTPTIERNGTKYSSVIHMKKSVIYIGGDPSSAKKRLCLEDFIELQEIIVPIVVGGALALLMALIFVSYIIAYVRRRRREAKLQYERVGDF